MGLCHDKNNDCIVNMYVTKTLLYIGAFDPNRMGYKYLSCYFLNIRYIASADCHGRIIRNIKNQYSKNPHRKKNNFIKI